MEKRVVLFLIVSVAVLFGWMTLQQKLFPPPPPEEAPAAPATAQPAAPGEVAKPGTPPSGAAAEKGPAQPPAGQAARAPESFVTVERAGHYRARFSSWGAAPVEFTLLNPQYKTTVDGKDVPVDLVPKTADGHLLGERPPF